MTRKEAETLWLGLFFAYRVRRLTLERIPFAITITIVTITASFEFASEPPGGPVGG